MVSEVRRMSHLSRTWDKLGQRDRLWAILTWPDKQGHRWTVEEFLETGRAEANRVLQHVNRLTPACRGGRALDFGCGIGRITQALAAHFSEVIGVDVAPSMIEQATALNRIPDRCTFQVNRSVHLRCFATNSFDFVYSRLVLQHMPTEMAAGYLAEFVRVMTPGGLLVFQLPEDIAADTREMFLDAAVHGSAFKRAIPRPIVRLWRAVKYRWRVARHEQMEMYGMAKEVVLTLLRSHGGKVLEVRDDTAHGTEKAGFEYYVTK